MLSIGEFSNICKVSTKTLRYYAEIGLLLPDEIKPENGYRYYSIEQLKTMLFIKIYVTDPSQVLTESELITEVYYPVKKKKAYIQ